MSQYLGDISAYALAVSQGYTGTEEEYAELMASYATVGQTAVTAAQTATTKASEAATSATTATNKASEATTAAQTATNKAAEAQADADAAALDASQAMSAASTATTKATEATTAAATATSAKTDAVAANTAAQSAKTAAQTAQTGAETAAASVSASAEQIQTNADDISELKEEFTTTASKEDMLKSFPTDTASGSVASFADGANVPVKSLIVNIDPVQEGSGDPSPTNIRPISGHDEVNVVHTSAYTALNCIMPLDTYNGVKIATNADGTVTFKGTCTGNASIDFYRNSASFPSGLEAGKQYIVSLNKPIDTFDVFSYKGSSLTSLASFSAESYKAFTIPSDATGMLIRFLAKSGVTYDTTIRVMLCPADDFATLNIQLGQTVYGGKLDVTNGVLTTYPYYASYNGETLTGAWISDRDKYVSGTTPTTGAQVVNIGGAGTDVQLTPHEVRSLLGSNNVLADTGDTEVTYRADPTLYIGRLTEPDADMVADSNITSGQYFMVGNTLYKATANIASGGAITPNVNCTRKSLSEALNEINA